jgi:hypothetical protein
VPVAFLGLNWATSGDKEPYFTRMITNTYNKYANTWADRNNIHTEMIEQAAADRVLFLNEASQSVRHVDLRFPEYVSTLGLERERGCWRELEKGDRGIICRVKARVATRSMLT